jgi:TIR domain
MSTPEAKPKLIFVSHKSTDKNLASSIVTLLKSYMDNVRFFLSEEIEKGDEWRANIETTLKDADFLLLVYTDASYDWSWCLYEAILFDEVVRRPDPEHRKLYCIHFPGSPPPDPLQKLQTITATNDDIGTWLANFYQATNQSSAFRSLEAAAAKLGEVLREGRPKQYKINYLRPSIRVHPAWLRGDQHSPDWLNLATIPPNLPLELSDVTTDDISASQLGFNQTPGTMNIVDFLERLDTEGSQAERGWITRFLESLQATLEGRMADQNVVFFRSVRGNVLRPIIESITRSQDGLECTCRVVFVDAFSVPPASNPSQLQLLANGLRLAVRMRLEVLDRYRGKMARERLRLSGSNDPVEELGKFHPLGSRVLETLRTIVLEAEMQGSRLEADPPTLFEGEDQVRYEEIREVFKTNFAELERVTETEDQQREGTYTGTEKILDSLLELNKDYLRFAAPRFMSLLNARVGS